MQFANIDSTSNSDVLFLDQKHLRPESKLIPIEDLWYRDFNEYFLSLKTIINSRVIVYQSPEGEINILKSGSSVSGTLLNERLLIKEGWLANQETQRYEKEGEDFYLKIGKQYPLCHPITNQQILSFQSIDVYDISDNEIMCTVSTMQELLDVFSEDEYLYSFEENRIPELPEFINE